MTGIERIATERQRQIEVEGYTSEHDTTTHEGDLALAGATYALPPRHRYGRQNTLGDWVPMTWPWAPRFWKPCPNNRIRELEKAGALIAAEIDRLLACG